MIYIVLGLYALILISFVLTYFFIIYHLAKYSINSGLNKIILPFFIVISLMLIFSNIFLFFAVDWNDLISRLF